MDEWSMDFSDLTAEADQPEAEAENEVEENAEAPAEETTAEETAGAEGGESAGEQPKADQLFELKHLDEVRSVTLDDMRVLAQKGMDYDRIRERADSVKRYEDFLKEMADGQDVESFMDTVRARKLAGKDGIDETTALERVKLNREREELNAQKESEKPDPETERRQKSYVEFKTKFPALNSSDIPDEVWAAHQKGDSLTVAYLDYQNKSLNEKVKALEQNQKNKERTTGSLKSDGAAKALDEWEKMWNNGN
jgi:hypothetical protein